MFGVAFVFVWPRFFVFFLSTCDSLPVNQKKAKSILVFCSPHPLSNCQIYVLLLQLVWQWMHSKQRMQGNVWKMPQGDVSCALQHYSHAIWVKTFTTNEISDPSHHISAKSWPSEPYLNTYVHMWPLWYCPRSWTLVKAAQELLPAFSSCSDWCWSTGLLHVLTYIDTKWHWVVL